MNPLLIVLPFCEKDVDSAIRLMTWINELNENNLGAVQSILLAADSSVPLEKCKELKALAQKSFYYVETTSVRVVAKDWRAPNEMFRGVVSYIKSAYKMAFLWLEPDAVPLASFWLDILALTYAQCPRKYMGGLVECKDPKLPAVHMTGCAVYPADAIDLLDRHCNEKAEAAWDISSAKDVVGACRAQGTKLIQSFYGEQDLAPSFVRQKVQGNTYAANVFDVSFLNEQAILFHRCKDGSLIDVLRELRKENASAPQQSPTPEMEAAADGQLGAARVSQSERMKEVWAKRRAQKQESLAEQPKATE